jgi:hypothetical protein
MIILDMEDTPAEPDAQRPEGAGFDGYFGGPGYHSPFYVNMHDQLRRRRIGEVRLERAGKAGFPWISGPHRLGLGQNPAAPPRLIQN